MGGGAYCTGTQWMPACSREYKENITELTREEAVAAFLQLNPVTFNYKDDPSDRCVGFIAEDVPGLIATQDRKSLSPMDIVAVLTKVVQEQQKMLQQQQDEINQLKKLLGTE
jgi:hypothetical protein